MRNSADLGGCCPHPLDLKNSLKYLTKAEFK